MTMPKTQGPLCLVEDKGDAGLQVNNSALEILHNTGTNLHVISIIGPAQTGKSYLLNRLARQHGFRVGHSEAGQSAGLYGWCLPHPTNTGDHILLLDTQRTSTLFQENKEQTILIMTLATLLADKGTTVFNCLNTISQDGLDLLHSVSQTAKLISECHSSETEGASEAHQRHLVWVIRDFFLELSTEVDTLTSDEYLERALKSRSGNDKGVQLSNKIRSSIRDYFKKRDCICIPFPSEDRDILVELENVQQTQVEKDFLEKVQEFCERVLRSDFQNISSKELTKELHQYVGIIHNQNISPVLSHTIYGLQKAMMDEAEWASSHPPMGKHDGASELTRPVGDLQFTSMSGIKLDHMKYDQPTKTNSAEKLKELKDILENLHRDVLKKTRSGAYYHQGGIEEYQNDMQDIREKFQLQSGEEELAKEALKQFEQETESSLVILTKTIKKLYPKIPEEPPREPTPEKEPPPPEPGWHPDILPSAGRNREKVHGIRNTRRQQDEQMFQENLEKQETKVSMGITDNKGELNEIQQNVTSWVTGLHVLMVYMCLTLPWNGVKMTIGWTWAAFKTSLTFALGLYLVLYSYLTNTSAGSKTFEYQKLKTDNKFQ